MRHSRRPRTPAGDGIRPANDRANSSILLAVAAAIVLAGCGDEPGQGRNTAPSVSLRASMSLVKAGVEVEFTADAADAEGNIALFAWDFGDGTASAGAQSFVRHAFPAEGRYLVSVTVTDTGGLSGTDELAIETTPPGGAPLLTVEQVALRGPVLDATRVELAVNGTGPVPVEEGEFLWTDGLGSSPRSWTFEAIDRGGNSSRVEVTIAPVQ